MQLSTLLNWARVDVIAPSRAPSIPRLITATVIAIGGSLLADALLVAIGTALFPGTKGYEHFGFGDYATLTVLGVLAACVGWPIVASMTGASRWLFARLAVLVTVVLLAPDVWLIIQSNPLKAVAVLVVMHLAIAVVTYNALVWVAPSRSLDHSKRQYTLPTGLRQSA